MIDLPLPDQYWQPPQRRGQGDGHEDAIYLAVGKALSEWELVEWWFAGLFGLLVAAHAEGQQFVAAERAYGVVVSGPVRKEMLQQAAKVFFAFAGEKQEKDEFDLLIRHYDAALVIRNHIAHGTATRWIIDDVDHGIFLEPPSHNSKKTKRDKMQKFEGTNSDSMFVTYRYTSDQILEFCSRFRLLKFATSRYRTDLGQKYGPEFGAPKVQQP